MELGNWKRSVIIWEIADNHLLKYLEVSHQFWPGLVDRHVVQWQGMALLRPYKKWKSWRNWLDNREKQLFSANNFGVKYSLR